MESIWSNSTVKINKKINMWHWMGRVIPLLYIPISLLFFNYGTLNIINTFAIITVAASFTIAIIWWWWAMDTMNYLADLHNKSIQNQQNILIDIKNLRQDINKINQ